MTEPLRLAKHLAALLPCSRREAELYIEGGWVLVDDQTVEEPQARVAPGQQVALAPGAVARPVPPVTLLFHKPAGLDLSAFDAGSLPADHVSGAIPGGRLLRRHFTRQTLAAPLEPQASGLVVWSQDVAVLRKLRDDWARMESELVVDVQGSVPPDALQRLNAAVSQGVPVKASWQSERRLRLALKGLQPGQVESLCTQAGLAVAAVRRLRLGRIPLRGLTEGLWAYLPAHDRF